MSVLTLLQVLDSIRKSNFSYMGPDFDIRAIEFDSRLVNSESVFVAIRGNKSDGHDYLLKAVEQGARVLVVEDRKNIPTEYSGIVVEVADTRQALDLLASQFNAWPARSMFCFGVTGTNGKTSITYMIEHILNKMGVPTAVVGTVDHHLGDRVWPSEMTTPNPVLLQSRLREFREAGARAVAMEVSSHALAQHRVDSIPFNTVIFTNLTRDHLDYHSNMHEYFSAKQRLFTDLMRASTKLPRFAIVNVDDAWGRRLKIADPSVVLTYGTGEADFSFQIKSISFAHTLCALKTPLGEYELLIPLVGVHNVYNTLAAMIACLTAGFSIEKCLVAMQSFTGVPGRLQAVENNRGLHVYVDYAHSPDALENVLKSLQKVKLAMGESSSKEKDSQRAQIHVVFGCGGDRDRGKRPIMAKIACQYADHVIVTSDNPRTEDPQSIMSEVMAGVISGPQSTQSILDRREAIAKAFAQANAGDVVLIAGKGHEDYQIIGDKKLNFSDVQVARELLQR